MESKSSEPGEGENNDYSHTPDGHGRAGPRPAAVVGSDSGTELRSVPARLNGASAAGRVRLCAVLIVLCLSVLRHIVHGGCGFHRPCRPCSRVVWGWQTQAPLVNFPGRFLTQSRPR